VELLHYPVKPFGTSRVPLPHVSLILASKFHFGIGILFHFAFSSLTWDTESSFDSVKWIRLDSCSRNETSGAQSVLYADIPGSDLNPVSDGRYSYFQLSFHFWIEFIFHITFFGILTRDLVISSALDWIELVLSIETPKYLSRYIPNTPLPHVSPLACNFHAERRS
jgi:hypothetical protein